MLLEPAVEMCIRDRYKERTTDYNYNRASGDLSNVMQLCEKLYGNDLKKDEGIHDDFGRPATRWIYDTNTVTTPDKADLTYLDEVKGETIYKDLGKVNGVTLATVYTGSTQGYMIEDVYKRQEQHCSQWRPSESGRHHPGYSQSHHRCQQAGCR